MVSFLGTTKATPRPLHRSLLAALLRLREAASQDLKAEEIFESSVFGSITARCSVAPGFTKSAGATCFCTLSFSLQTFRKTHFPNCLLSFFEKQLQNLCETTASPNKTSRTRKHKPKSSTVQCQLNVIKNMPKQDC